MQGKDDSSKLQPGAQHAWLSCSRSRPGAGQQGWLLKEHEASCQCCLAVAECLCGAVNATCSGTVTGYI